MIFNKNEIFNDNLNYLQDDCLYISLNELSQLLISLNIILKSDEMQNLESNKLNSALNSDNNCIFIENLEILDELSADQSADQSDEIQSDDLGGEWQNQLCQLYSIKSNLKAEFLKK